MPEPIKICYLDGCRLEMPMSLTLMAAGKVTMDDAQHKKHPNAMPFTGTLLLVGQPSNKPPQGAQGHLISVDKDVAERLLPTLVGMAINYSEELDHHEVTKKIGVISAAWIKGSEVKVRGLIWAKDFPEAAKTIKAHSPNLGMSMELADIWVENKDAKVWKLRDFKFTGGTILLKRAAAYHGTSLAASAQKFYVKSLAAAAAVLDNSTEGENRMKPKRKTGRHSTSSTTRLAAAVASGISANLADPLEQLQASIGTLAAETKSNGKMLRLLAKAFVESTKAAGKGRVKAKKDASDNSSDTSDMSANASASNASSSSDTSDMSAAAEEVEDELTAALDDSSDSSDHGKKRIKAKAKNSSDDSTDDSEDSSDDSDDSMDAEFDAGDDHGGSDNSDAEPGKVNKNAMSKAKKNATRHLHASAAEVKELRAQAERIDELTAALEEANNNAKKYKTRSRKLERRVGAIQAQLEKHSEQMNRQTLPSEIIYLLDKSGHNVNEMRASGDKLTNAQVDAVLGADPAMKLDPTTRIKIKHQLLQAGLMFDDYQERVQ